MFEPFHNVAKIFYMILAFIGVTVNLLSINILSRGKCDVSTCTTHYLVAMAIADLIVIITEVILRQIKHYYFPRSFLDITPVCSVNAVLLFAATDCSVWFTVTFSFDRFVAICCRKLKTKYCTKKTAILVLSTTCILLCFRNIPFYFGYEPLVIINKTPWFCYPKASYFTDPRWVAFDWFDKALTPLLPFALILLINTLTVRFILLAGRVRKGLRGQKIGEERKDREMDSRRKSVVLLFAISSSFILLWSLYVAEFIHYIITGSDHREYTDIQYIIQQVGYILVNLSCCTNTFIYAVTQSKFRKQIKNAWIYPVRSIIQLIQRYKNRATSRHCSANRRRIHKLTVISANQGDWPSESQ